LRLIQLSNLLLALLYDSMSMAKLEVAITELISLSLMVSLPLKAAWELRANSKMSSLTARQFW
jgi:hypothetical protein